MDRILSVQRDYVDVIQDEIDTALHAAGDRERPEELRKTLTTVSRKVDSEVCRMARCEETGAHEATGVAGFVGNSKR